MAESRCSGQTTGVSILAPLLATQMTWCHTTDPWASALHLQNEVIMSYLVKELRGLSKTTLVNYLKHYLVLSKHLINAIYYYFYGDYMKRYNIIFRN